MPTPPPDATSLDLRGKRCFEVLFSDDGDRRYIIRDKADKNTFKPLNTNDRVFYLNEEDKRIARKKKSALEVIERAIPYIVLIVIFGLLLAFWGDILEPFNSRMTAAENSLNQRVQMEIQVVSMLKEIIKKEQVISGDIEIIQANSTSPPPE